MFELIYAVLFVVMLFEILIFLLLNLPFPKSWKAAVFRTVANTPSIKVLLYLSRHYYIHQGTTLFIKAFLKFQLLACLLAAFFLADLSSQERVYGRQKNKLQAKNSLGAGKVQQIQVDVFIFQVLTHKYRQSAIELELRKTTLSYQIIKIQRNKYISSLVIFTFLVSLGFFWVKEKRFEIEEQYKDQLQQLANRPTQNILDS